MIAFLGLSPALDVTYLVGRFAVGDIHRPREVITLPGGKSLNAARAAASLGARARAIAPLGGFTGARVRAALDVEASTLLEVLAIETGVESRSCVTIVADDGVTTELYEPAPVLPDATWSAVAAAAASVQSGWIALSGSVPAGAEARIADMLADAAGRGVRVAVDTHGPALATVLDRFGPALVKVNRHEASELLGEMDAAHSALTLSARTGGTAVVTAGADGAVGARDGSAWRSLPPRLGRYAVGSGDSFLAGLLVALDDDPHGLPNALALATAAATANTLIPGAARFDPAIVPGLRAAVTVSRHA